MRVNAVIVRQMAILTCSHRVYHLVRCLLTLLTLGRAIHPTNVVPSHPGPPVQNHIFIPTDLVQPPTMPPVRTESWQKSANQEGKILLGLADIKNGRIKSIRAAAKLYEIPRATLQTRVQGVVSIVERRPPPRDIN